MFLIERSANRQVAFKFGNCPMRLMPFAPDNSGSIFIDNSSAKSTTHAKRRFVTVSQILTSKQEWNLLLTNRSQQWTTIIRSFNAKLGEPLAIKYLTHFSRQTHTSLTSSPIAADCGSALWRLYHIWTKNKRNGLSLRSIFRNYSKKSQNIYSIWNSFSKRKKYLFNFSNCL